MNDNEHISKPYQMNTSDDDLVVEDDHFDKETAYESWQESSLSRGGGFFRRYGVLLALLIIALLILYILYSALRPKTNAVHLSQMTLIDSRIDGLELRVSQLEEKTAETKQPGDTDVQMETIDRLSDRVDRLERSFKTWMEEVTAKMEAIQKKPVAKKPPSQKTKTQSKPKKQVTVKKKGTQVTPKAKKPTPAGNSKARYHTVQPSETLYRISVKYGVPVERIKELNKLPNNTIKPGQKLQLAP